MLVESMSSMISPEFWRNRRVFVTGHTGFKGSWLSLWLETLGATVSGYSLSPNTNPALFYALQLGSKIHTTIADVRDPQALAAAIADREPEVVFHLAAQPLVRKSIADPLNTYSTNVMGTVHLLESIRHQPSVRAAVIVTTDKCYENREWHWGYREGDRLGGNDPYSSSKACAELVTRAFIESYFLSKVGSVVPLGVATVRAGNVIGGGDWSPDRLLPDAIRAFSTGQTVYLRYPTAVRPWQHVLDPLGGYLILAERLFNEGERYQGPWNFGPTPENLATVEEVVKMAARSWHTKFAKEVTWASDPNIHPKETSLLMLDSTKSNRLLGWYPVYRLENAIQKVVEFSYASHMGIELRRQCVEEIEEYHRLSESLGKR